MTWEELIELDERMMQEEAEMMTAYKLDPTEESFGSFIDKHATEEYKTWLKTEQKRRAEAYNQGVIIN